MPSYRSWLAASLALATLAGAAARAERYEAYAVKVYDGPLARPDFSGSGRKHRLFRTVIREGASGGVNFAGHYALVGIGCGAGCRLVVLVDVRSGRISSFPLSGEKYFELQLKYRRDSRLVQAAWQDDLTCVTRELVFTGQTFTTLRNQRQDGDCPNRE